MDVRPARASEIGLVCDILTAAFLDDRFFSHMFPDVERRAKALPGYFAAFVELAWKVGQIHLAGDGAGVAVTFPPGFAPGGPLLDMRRNNELNTCVFEASGVDAPTVAAVIRDLGKHMPTGCEYEYWLYTAVRPGQRGRLGLALMKHVCDAADRSGVSIYTEASSARTRSLALHLGFRDHPGPFGPGGGPELFPMWREPRGAVVTGRHLDVDAKPAQERVSG